MSTNIDKLEAGRELDAAVWAALGYEVKQLWCWQAPGYGDWIVSHDGDARGGGETEHPCYFVEPDPDDPASDGYWAVVPFVSTEIAAAWVMVEEIRKRGYDVTLKVFPQLEDHCRIAPRGEFNTPRVVMVSGISTPAIICCAALRTLAADGE